jgi:hypothetical protein
LTGAPDTGSSPEQPELERVESEASIDPDSTVGTGSVFAIGCTVMMLIILLIGIAIFISRQAN